MKKIYAIIMAMLMLFPAIALAEICTDTDNGQDYYQKGQAILETGANLIDHCPTTQPYNAGKTLLEAYCIDTTPYVVYKEYECPNGCKGGACIQQQQQQQQCTDTDNGKEYAIKGKVKYNLLSDGKYQGSIEDSCSGNILNEYICENKTAKTTYYNCPYGCEDGACLAETTLSTQTGNSAIETFTFTIKTGDVISWEGMSDKKITLQNVGSGGAIVIDVDGTIETIAASTTKTVNGIEVTNDESFYADAKENRVARIKVKLYGVEAPNPIAPTRQPVYGGAKTTQPQPTPPTGIKIKVNCNNAGDALSKYPAPFIQNGELTDFAIVVGSEAPASDTLAAVDIATSLHYLQSELQSENSPTETEIIDTKLDTEITDRNKNLILIGSPSENKLIGELTSENFGKGHGLIKAFEVNGYTHLIVAGKDAIDRRRAAKVLIGYKEYSLRGDKCEVIYAGEEPTGTTQQPTATQPQPAAEETTEQIPKELKPNVCGNNICETNANENSQTCPQDCGKIVTTLQCSGCIKNNECLQYGIRLGKDGDSTYCSISKQFELQKQAGESCANSFECESNVCVDSECISGSVIQKILNWFKRLFG